MVIATMVCSHLLVPGWGQTIQLVKRGAGHAKWSPDGQYVTYHARGADRYYDVYIMEDDWTNPQCLTCDRSGFPQKHIGEPSWHPSGQWIVFKAQKRDHVFPDLVAGLAEPGIGFHNDVWIMTPDASQAYRLTYLETQKMVIDPIPTTGLLHPHFSGDGLQLSWSERMGGGGKWGEWGVRVADFEVGTNNVPAVSNVRTYQPGANQLYYESNDFMPQQPGKMLICGNLEPTQTAFGIDIYYLDTTNGQTERLTHSLDVFDECPHPSPDGSQIAYLSTDGFSAPEGENNDWWWTWARGEYWLMDADGSNKAQLTHYNTPGYPEYTGKRVIPAYVAWNSTGDQLLLSIVSEEWWGLEDQIHLVDLTPPP